MHNAQCMTLDDAREGGRGRFAQLASLANGTDAEPNNSLWTGKRGARMEGSIFKLESMHSFPAHPSSDNMLHLVPRTNDLPDGTLL